MEIERQSGSAVSLPAVGVGCHRIGWCGFALALPEEWGLSFYSAVGEMGRRGLVVFSDMRGAVLEVRWEVPRRWRVLRMNPGEAMRRRLEKLRRAGKGEGVGGVEEVAGAFVLRERGLALVADGGRVYELHCVREGERLEGMVRDFVKGLEVMAGGEWLWAVYGVEVWLPAGARLRQVVMRAGECRLEFGLGRRLAGSRVTAGAVSLAGQVLRGRTLRGWAEAELGCVKGGTGVWEEGEDWARWRGRLRQMGRMVGQEVEVRRDGGRNQIRWTHRVKRGK